jgi:hypothetical protein
VLSWRVVRGARLGALGRWLVVVGAAGGAGLLLLSALGWALGHPQPGGPGAGVRLVWCLLPVALTVQLAAVAAWAQPLGWSRGGLAAVGLGRTATVLVGAAGAALACAAGSALALLVFLYLRGDLGGVPYAGAASGVLGAGHRLPVAGAATLLAVVPLAAAATVAVRLRQTRAPRQGAAPAGLPWGVALTAVGLATQAGAPHGDALPLPSGLGSVSSATVAGWVTASAGMVLAGPGLVHLCGRLLALHRPGALRLLSGRALQQEARRIGRPLGLLCATATAAFAGYGLQHDAGHGLGPVTSFAAALIGVCVLAIAVTAVVEARSVRARSTAALREVGAPPALLRGAVALRAGVLLAVAVPLTVLVAAVATVPATR